MIVFYPLRIEMVIKSYYKIILPCFLYIVPMFKIGSDG